MRIIILTGSEIRHSYFRKQIASDNRINVLASYCESPKKSLENCLKKSTKNKKIKLQHFAARLQAEQDFFSDCLSVIDDKSRPKFITRGKINDSNIVKEIINIQPELLVCYGSSIIKSDLIEKFRGRFLNVHLGLSPYYRGSGTNVWPLINNEPDMIGATFMNIDSGVDTGEIIHQIRADIVIGDSPHSIGNRLIRKMTKTLAEVIVNKYSLEDQTQPSADGKLYLQNDFDHNACRKLYDNLNCGLIENHLNSNKELPYIVINKAIEK